jgi:hypothetical protein
MPSLKWLIASDLCSQLATAMDSPIVTPLQLLLCPSLFGADDSRSPDHAIDRPGDVTIKVLILVPLPMAASQLEIFSQKFSSHNPLPENEPGSSSFFPVHSWH